LPKCVTMTHDNAHPYSAANSVASLRQLKFEVMSHTPYCPDLAPSIT
jgi:hypothetical protein